MINRLVIARVECMPMRGARMGVRTLSLACVAVALLSLPTFAGAEACTNEQARNESGSKGLPDCRVYELVSPTDKTHDTAGVRRPYYLETSGFPMESSPEGDVVTYIGEQFYEALSGQREQEYLSTRGPDGWGTKNLTPIQAPTTTVNSYVGFSAAAATGVFFSKGPEALSLGVPEGYAEDELYLRGSDGDFTPLITVKPPNRTPSEFGYAYLFHHRRLRTRPPALFVGASADFKHIFFEANDALTGETPFAPKAEDGGEFSNNLYEWSDGVLRLVNVLPEGRTEPDASFGAEHGEAFTGMQYEEASVPTLEDAVSSDGLRAFWTDENNGNLYVREDGERTVQVDAGVGGGGVFQAASTDGSRVFFTKGGDLYEYDLESALTTDLAPAGEVQGLVGVSDDGSYVYFVAQGVLAPGANIGEDNLYLRHAGTTTFITTLAPEDNEFNEVVNDYYTEANNEGKGVWSSTFAGRLARVSPDGRYLAFPSSRQLTSFPIPATTSRYGRVEIYLYDAVSGQLSCASCGRDGNTPVKPAWLPPFPALTDGIHQARWLDDSGQVFFFSEEELSPGTPEGGLYEYEGGDIHLLAPSHADGMGGGPSVTFLDASESGDDVFFRTTSELVPNDQDELGDIYDARVNGHLPAAVRAPCVAEGCQGEATPTFAASALVTAALGPSGNLAPAPPVVQPHAKSKAKTHSKAKNKKKKAKKKASKRRKRTSSRKERAHR